MIKIEILFDMIDYIASFLIVVRHFKIMEQFITSYGVDFERFQTLLQTTNSIVAGSSALALYLKQNDIEPGFEPTDIDIWIEDTFNIVSDINGYIQRGNIFLFTKLLLESGYNLTTKFQHFEDNNYTRSITKIKQMFSFVNQDNKEIQLIVVTEHDLIQYICTHFDMTQCMTWWNAFSNQFETLFPDLTCKKKISIMNKSIIDQERFNHRLGKYHLRGFTEIEVPPLFQHIMDSRTGLDSDDFKDVQAFDVWNYEDVSSLEFLKKSHWNIIICIGEQFHAFHREHLYKFMSKKQSILPVIGHVYDTPYHQSITKKAVDIIPFSDYSIFELVEEYNVPYRHSTKTLYTMKCYTVEDWIKGNPSYIISPPDREFIEVGEEVKDDEELFIPLVNEELREMLEDELPVLVDDSSDDDNNGADNDVDNGADILDELLLVDIQENEWLHFQEALLHLEEHE